MLLRKSIEKIGSSAEIYRSLKGSCDDNVIHMI